MLIVPDVHGRVFWKEPLSKYPDEEVVFLGDYLDPYPDEGISPGEALYVFKEILDLKRKNPEKITLLLGNHDLMYLDPVHKRNCCRHDWEHDSEISNLFKEALKEDPAFFILAKEYEGYVFSHSGIHPSWIEYGHPEFKGETIQETIEKLNSTLWEPSTLKALDDISWYRGGWGCDIGSPVWSDVREWYGERNYKDIENGYIQIFGHTQLLEGKSIEGKTYKCIDCKRVSRIDSNNKFSIL